MHVLISSARTGTKAENERLTEHRLELGLVLSIKLTINLNMN